MGAWIEISNVSSNGLLVFVAPVWGRGLKFEYPGLPKTRMGRPRMGAWIEIESRYFPGRLPESPPYGGVD